MRRIEGLNAVGNRAVPASSDDHARAQAARASWKDQLPVLYVPTYASHFVGDDETEPVQSGNGTLGSPQGPTSLLVVALISACFWIILFALLS